MPYQTFQTSDGWIIVAVGNDGQFRKFVEAGGRPELAEDARFATNPARVRNRETLVPILADDGPSSAGKQQWIAALEAAGVPCGPINDLGEVFENEQVIARGLRVDLPHPRGGTVKLVRNPVQHERRRRPRRSRIRRRSASTPKASCATCSATTKHESRRSGRRGYLSRAWRAYRVPAPIKPPAAAPAIVPSGPPVST